MRNYTYLAYLLQLGLFIFCAFKMLIKLIHSFLGKKVKIYN